MRALLPRVPAPLAFLVAASLMHQSASAQVILGDGTTSELTIEEVLEDAPPIKRVEEDWEVFVADPDPAADIPQICTVFGPTDAAFDTHVVFELNHGTLPSFAEGGMQLQVWWANSLIGYRGQFSPTELNTAGETVKYTTVTRLHDHKLRMYIKSGTSSTWGPFGSTSSLYVWLWTGREDLNPYDPQNSIRHSRVTFGANRVNRFCRREIRFYDFDADLIAKDTATYYVHRLATDIGSDSAVGDSGSNGDIGEADAAPATP